MKPYKIHKTREGKKETNLKKDKNQWIEYSYIHGSYQSTYINNHFKLNLISISVKGQMLSEKV